MKGGSVQRRMPGKSAVVFALLHDYDRRLEWDTLLCEARLTRGYKRARKGATSLCVGKPFFGLIGVETRYVSFREGELAAVEMVNRPPFFANFAASIRHEDNGEGSTVTYKFRFSARPVYLQVLLEPIMLRYLRNETEKRLEALAAYLADPDFRI